MTTARLQRVPPQNKKSRNVFTRILAFFAPGDFITLFIVTLLLLMPALSLNEAEWPISMRVVLPVLVSSTILGLLLARSQFNEFLALIISSTYGVCFIVLVAAMGEGNLVNGVYDVFVRSITWFVDATSGGINQDDLVFTLLVATLFWFLGYNASWHTFRIDRIWRVVIPPGLILITNNVFYDGNNDLNIYLIVFMFAALLLIAHSNLDNREWEWYDKGIFVPKRLRRQFLLVGMSLATVTLLFAWTVPSGNLQERSSSFREFLQANPFQQAAEFWNRLFSPIDAQGPTTADYYGGDSLDLSGAIQLGDQTVLLVDAPTDRRYYWRSRIFDTYEAGRWTPAADIRLHDEQAPFNVTLENDLARIPIQQEFTIALSGSRLIYTAPQPSIIDLTVRADLRYTASEADANRAMNISVIRPTTVLRRGDTYTATSMMSIATATELRQASTAYPEWIESIYFYVSPSITDRTRNLASQIVVDANASNPYDMSRAIEGWLRRNIVYNENIPAPPNDQDPVDWVLFDGLEGYCNYYASAMIMMLRSQGIPARMAAGFAQGDYDIEQGGFVVTERDAHTWVEVYFPGYGWIEFEPTAAQAPLEREDDDTFSEAPAPIPPAVTETPTITPSPEPTITPNVTPTPTGTNDPESDNANPPTQAITPTFTPSPTATPVIIPTQPSPISPEPQSPLEFILPALGFAFLGLIVIAVVIALLTFLYWWWEWRGMGGLSPVTRAYARLERYASLIGIRFSPEQTPEERRKNMVKGLPKIERPVTAITRLYTTERYSRPPEHPAENHQKSQVADQAWSDTRGNILRRWLRRFIPWKRNE